MTCAQGLLRLLWGGGGAKLECYGTVQGILKEVRRQFAPISYTVNSSLQVDVAYKSRFISFAKKF